MYNGGAYAPPNVHNGDKTMKEYLRTKGSPSRRKITS